MDTNNTDDIIIDLDINFEGNILFSILSVVLFGALSLLLLWVYQQGDGRYVLRHRYDIVLTGFTALTAVLGALSFDEGYPGLCDIYFSCNIVTIVVFGIIVLMIGGVKLFDIRRSNTEMIAIGEHTGSMSMFVLAMTIPLLIFEVFMCIGAAIKMDVLNLLLMLVGLLQKLIQAGIYRFNLRLNVPAKNEFRAASLYFLILALFNFNMWLESMTISLKQGSQSISDMLGEGFSLFSSVYTSLIIDYRLLVCIIFLEHSMHIKKEYSSKVLSKAKLDQELEENEEKTRQITSPQVFHESVEIAENFKLRCSQLSGCGYLFGVTLFTLQLLNAMQYTKYLGPWTNIFGIFADLTVICIGVLFVKQVRKKFSEEFHKDTISVGIETLVITMAVISVLYWALKGMAVTIWAIRMLKETRYTDNILLHDKYRYFFWNGTKDLLRPISILFQLYIFVCSDIKVATSKRMRKEKCNHFFIPLLMLAFLSIFINSITDGYTGNIEKFAEKSSMTLVFHVVYKCGEPVHLGFTLHMFVHFFIINSQVTNTVFPIRLVSTRSTHNGPSNDYNTPLLKDDHE